MKNNKYFLPAALAAVLGLALLVCVMIRTFAPAVIIPGLDIPGMVLLSLVALLLDHYLAKDAKRCWVCIPLFAAVAFGLLPWAACFVSGTAAVKMGIMGGVVFPVVTWLFSSMTDRLSTGPAAKAAPFLSALGLFLASQCLMGIIL